MSCVGATRRDDGSRRGRLLLAAAVPLTAVLAVWASAVPDVPRVFGPPLSGPVRVFGVDDTAGPPASEIEARPFRGPTTSDDGTLAFLVGWGAVALVGLLLLVVLVLLVRALVRHLATDRSLEADDAAGPDLARVGAALASDSAERLAVLGRGGPAEGVIAAWDHLEGTLRATGVPLPESRTSTETVVGVLRRFAVDEDSLQTLAGLYREAAWSGHVLTEADRATAEAALGRLDTDLAAALSTPVGGAGA